MKTLLTFLLVLFLASSCEKEETPNKEYRVVVESTADISCKLPIIRFLDQEAEVKRRTSMETLTYTAYHLDSSLNAVGDTLIVEFTHVAEEDFRLCLAIGFGYPSIAIVNARIVD